MKQGDVFEYRYLWGHEKEAGRTDGSKIRRACLIVKTENYLYMYPITTLEPVPVPGKNKPRVYAKIPEIEARRAGLTERSFLVLDDVNICKVDELYDFEGTPPKGSFSKPFLAQIKAKAIAAVKAGATTAVAR